ncbi:hypothetical protein [Delftia acidovorans]|uniref:hypothetical protein n=1 Tax=Delftia acidovorans TaxID=80866 RepID=UPI0005510BEE|nr:hypothetical protein [Delftia acidovorans]QQB53560.1 hypothetical protein I6H54_15495 [Delftia acidovorans]
MILKNTQYQTLIIRTRSDEAESQRVYAQVLEVIGQLDRLKIHFLQLYVSWLNVIHTWCYRGLIDTKHYTITKRSRPMRRTLMLPGLILSALLLAGTALTS